MPINRLSRCAALLIFTIVALPGCSKTSLTNLWTDPGQKTAMDNVLVIVLERDAELRRAWEDALVAEFQARGVHARSSHQMLPVLPDSAQVPVIMRRDGNDGAVIAHRLAATQSGEFDSGYAKSTAATGSDYWRSWYHTYYTAANDKGNSSKEKEARYQIDLVGIAGGGKLVWMGSTTPLNPRDEKKIREEVAGQLVPELERQGLIPGGN